jgi:tetratricopeptide (TPR) repeat protein
MTSEYLGYKNLERETRKWFEHEIAPDKNDIVVPLELRPFYCTVKAFNDKYKEIESCVAKGVEACSQDVLWTGSILYYQRGKFDRAAGFLKALLSGGSGHADALYNLAHACMKLMRKQEAMDFFNEYRKRNPQSWWASVAMEHIRKLQTGHAT